MGFVLDECSTDGVEYCPKDKERSRIRVVQIDNFRGVLDIKRK